METVKTKKRTSAVRSKYPEDFHKRLNAVKEKRESESHERYNSVAYRIIQTNVGRSFSTMHGMCNGTLKNPNIWSVIAFLAFYNVTFDELFGDIVEAERKRIAKTFNDLNKPWILPK